jgi:hypothetical protein
MVLHAVAGTKTGASPDLIPPSTARLGPVDRAVPSQGRQQGEEGASSSTPAPCVTSAVTHHDDGRSSKTSSVDRK